MSISTYVVEHADGTEPAVGAGTEILGGRLIAVRFDDALRDCELFDWLVQSGATVVYGGRMDLLTGKSVRGHWLKWHDVDQEQEGCFATPQAAIEAAMAEEEAEEDEAA